MMHVQTRTIHLTFLAGIVFLLLPQISTCLSFSRPNANSNANRQALLHKLTNKLSVPSTMSSSREPQQWSNRVGSILTPASIPGVYTADRAFYWNQIDVGGRMGIIEFVDDSTTRSQLWIHSPVSLTEELVEVLEGLGDVKWVVSPNYEHVKYAREWAERYKDAVMVACPGLMERMDGVYNVEIPFGIRPGDDLDPNIFWDGSELVSLHIDCEVNPFTGKPFFNEVIFYHVPSKSLLVTDLYWNYPASIVTNEIYSDLPGGDVDFGSWELAPTVEKIPFGTRAWKFGMDQIYRPFYVNFMIKDEDRSRYNSIVNQIINVWEVETLIPAHGDIIRGKQVIKYVLQKHFGVK